MDKRTNRWWVTWVLVALVALLVGPASVASQEDAREEPAAKSEDPAKKKAETPAEPASADADDEQEEAAVHPSFNTIEEVVAFRGSVASLWTARTVSKPQVRWRVVEPAERDPS